jgi:hypothetical protein
MAPEKMKNQEGIPRHEGYRLSPEERLLERLRIEVESRRERNDLLERVYASKIGRLIPLAYESNLGHIIPGMDVAKMFEAAVEGEKTEDEKSSVQRRFSCAVIAAGFAIAWALLIAGEREGASFAGLVAGGIRVMEFHEEMIDEAVEKAQKSYAKVGHLLEQARDFIADEPQLAARVAERVRGFLGKGLKTEEAL